MSLTSSQADLAKAKIEDWNSSDITKLFKDYLQRVADHYTAGLTSADSIMHPESGKLLARQLGFIEGLKFAIDVNLIDKLENGDE